jgi:lysophospholipase L1-like esterase
MSHTRKIAALIALAVATLATLLATPAAAGEQQLPARTSAVVYVMPLGDSITKGAGDGNSNAWTAGYRRDLWNRLQGVGVAVNFVGSQVHGGPDPNHQGMAGWRIWQLQEYAAEWITTYQPDVVLLMAGTNDISDGTPPAVVLARLELLIDTIQATKPGIAVRVGTIPLRREPSTLQDETKAYNTSVQLMVSARWHLGQRISVVPIHQVSTSTLAYYDYVHPNACGYSGISWRWFTYLSNTDLNTTGAPWPAGADPLPACTLAAAKRR